MARSRGDYARKRCCPQTEQICTRALRKQVTEYILFTKRVPITQEFLPTSDASYSTPRKRLTGNEKGLIGEIRAATSVATRSNSSLLGPTVSAMGRERNRYEY